MSRFLISRSFYVIFALPFLALARVRLSKLVGSILKLKTNNLARDRSRDLLRRVNLRKLEVELRFETESKVGGK